MFVSIATDFVLNVVDTEEIKYNSQEFNNSTFIELQNFYFYFFTTIL